MLNKIFLMGRLVADPDHRQTPSGTSVTTFRIAVDRDFRNKETGEKEADFISVVTWRATADFVAKYFSKGRMIVVDGRLQTRNYTDRDGNRRTATEVVAENIYFGDTARRDSDGGYDRGGSGGYDRSGGGYDRDRSGGYDRGYPAQQQHAAPAPQRPAYDAPVPAGDQFTELDDDDGELPF